LFSNNISNDILCAHHFFLSYSNLGYLIMRWYYILYFYKALHTFFFIFFWKLFMRLGGLSCLSINKPFLSMMLNKIVLNHWAPLKKS
jgi:hypothetical protein